MGNIYKGHLDGRGLKIGIVVSRFNEAVTSRLLDGALEGLGCHGVAQEDVDVCWTPGSLELSIVAKRLAESGNYSAIICLGAVIRGETDHYEHVAGEAAKGIAAASQSSGIPVIFGVLTTETVEQAINRAGGKQGNIGYNAGVAAIEMANLLRAIDAD
ncbi:MAG: 6,7-dimethyl-8-ribityllumazine synthase [Chloroflexi bacterium]|nr:6,7-dimethyl-8-ribityllumazine synthase [Chloroflexota bacterium]